MNGAQGRGGDARGGRSGRVRQGGVPARDVHPDDAVGVRRDDRGPRRLGPTIVREMRIRDTHAGLMALNAPNTAPGGISRSIRSPLSAPATRPEPAQARDAARGVEGAHARGGRRHDPEQDRRRTRTRRSTSIASRSCCSTSTASSCRRSRATSAAARHRAPCRSRSRGGGRGEGRAAIGRRRAGHPLHRRLDRDAAGALGDLRAAHRQRGARARRAVRRHAERDASVHRRGSRVRRRVRRHRRRRDRELGVRRAHPARDAGAQQLRALLRAAARRADRELAGGDPARGRQAHGRRAVQRHPRLHARSPRR